MVAAVAGTVLSVRFIRDSVSLVNRLARLFREPTPDDADNSAGSDASAVRRDGGEPAADDAPQQTTAVAVVAQALPAGVRRFELTVRANVPVAGVDADLLTRHFETFDDGPGVVRARAVDVDGHGREVETATPLFVVRFAEPVDPDAVALDGSIDGHDEEPVPWSRLRLTPVDADD